MTTSRNKNTMHHDDSRHSQEIMRRKLEHLKIPIESDVQSKYNYFDDIKFLHYSLPEMDFGEVNLKTEFFNKSIAAPICISAITGGPPIAKEFNKTLALAAAEENIVMSVGSQRVGLTDPKSSESFTVVREIAPDIPLIGNIGVGQISDTSFDVGMFKECIEMIKADVMAVHFNALHELVQNEGDIIYKRFWDNFQLIRDQIKLPIIAKEVGTGFNYNLASKLDKMGFDGFDLGGFGGTNFVLIEKNRNTSSSKYTRSPTEVFKDWGIPTPVSILYVRSVSQKPIIATGGLRNGLDIAKSIALGADLGGFAYKFLLTAWDDLKNKNSLNTIREIRTLKNELQSALWLLNAKNPKELRLDQEKYVILGKLYQWLNQ